MTAILLARKDLLLLMRDRMALFWVFGFPVLFACLIGAVVKAGLDGDTSRIRVVLVEEANALAVQQVAARLAEAPRLHVDRASSREAWRRVQHAEAVAYLDLGGDPDGAPELVFDPAREMEVALLVQLLTPLLSGESDPVSPAALRRREIEISGNERNTADVVFPSAVLWGLIGCAASFVVSFVGERKSGTYFRLLSMGLGPLQVLAGKALACLIASLGVAVALTLIATLGFGVQVTRPLALSLALSSTALCFVGITMALGTTGRSEQAVAGAGWATLLLFAMLGGAMVPLSLMPDWFLNLSHLSPVKWGIEAIEGALWRDFSALELLVPCGVLISVFAVGLGFGAVSLLRERA